MGLPNLGLDTYLKVADRHDPKIKPFLFSISGSLLQNNLSELDPVLIHPNISGIELNFSCPNLIGKPQIGYDFMQTEGLLRHWFEKNDPLNSKIIGIKLPPYFDPAHFQQISDIVNQYPLDFLTCINSIGNGLVVDIDTEQTVIYPKKGMGGLGGAIVKPTALANVQQLSMLTKFKIIGCGGVTNGSDIFEHLLCGASVVQVGTQLMREGPRCFTRLQKELQSVMDSKGYSHISQFQGRLKHIDPE